MNNIESREEYFEDLNCSAIKSVMDVEYEIKFSYMKRIIQTFDNLDILVIGCGDGRLEKLLTDAHKVKSITLVDASRYCILQAQNRCNIADCICIDIAKINRHTFKHQYDIIYSFDVMQYLQPKEIRLLNSALIYYLRKDGHIYHFGVPEKKRKMLYRIEQCMTEHSIRKIIFPSDFIDKHSRWIEKKEFVSKRYNYTFLTPSLRFERFDVIISKN